MDPDAGQVQNKAAGGGLRSVARRSAGVGTRQNLMLPIMLATLVVRSLIVGAIVEDAR